MSDSPRSGRRRRSRSLFLFRLIPGTSPVHRLWAGTKLLSVAAIVLTLSLLPNWTGIAVFAGVDLLAAAVARIPRNALPRPPLWFWGSLGVGALVAVAAGGRPDLVVGSTHVGLGSLGTFFRAVVLAIVLLASSAILGWTTPLADLAPAVSRLGRPLRRLRFPVDELALCVALCIRCLPLLTEEIRTLLAARKLRPRHVRVNLAGDPRSRRVRARVNRPLAEVADLIGAILAVSLRRAGELGEAITVRGGTRMAVGHRPGPGSRDAFAALIVVAACATVSVVSLT
ncbi:MAG: ABC-type cobalt transport system, permease component CbiQ [Acidimicrobiaceae bacterium]|nr:ABC-type cobalt transport system, permease component CbiQ [Acidimicrobiaceae bacterium]